MKIALLLIHLAVLGVMLVVLYFMQLTLTHQEELTHLMMDGYREDCAIRLRTAQDLSQIEKDLIRIRSILKKGR